MSSFHYLSHIEYQIRSSSTSISSPPRFFKKDMKFLMFVVALFY